MLDSFDNDTLCSNNFGDSQGPQAMAFRRLFKRNSGTTVGPTFYHRRSRLHDQGTFYIHCRLEVIPAAGTVAWANSLIPSAETLDREATAPTCISQNLSPLWTRGDYVPVVTDPFGKSKPSSGQQFSKLARQACHFVSRRD